MKDKINIISINSDVAILTALKKMDAQETKLLLVFDENKFIGILSIGDIQRAIIKNINLQTKIEFILRKNFLFAHSSDTVEKIKKDMLKHRTEYMPILDNSNKLVDVLFWDDIFNETHETNKTKIDIPVVIMAGGKGTRLKPITNVIPKPLIPIGNETILETILDQFTDIGCNKFYISINHKADILRYYMSTLHKEYNIEYFKEEKPLGTIGSVSLLNGKIDSTFFVSNCDIIINQDYRDVYDYHRENKNEITVVVALKTFQVPYGVMESGENGLLISLDEKPELTFKINTGVYILEPHLINEIPQNIFFHITDLIEKVKYRNGRMGTYPVSEGSWKDIGDWNEYLKIINILP